MRDIFNNITESFGSLWHCIPRGNTIEVVTPYATVNDKFISVFITQQNSEYVVTDGGWCFANEYESDTTNTAKAFNRLFEFYFHQYDIKTIKANETVFYYKTTKAAILIPNLVFDLCNFISAIISASFVQYEDVKEQNEQLQFKKNVSDYILAFKPKEQCDFNVSIDNNHSDVKFNAVIKQTRSKLLAICYITGSNRSYFASSIAKANMNIDIIKHSAIAGNISDYIAVVNNQSSGYIEGSYFHVLQNNTGDKIVNWTEKERLPLLVS